MDRTAAFYSRPSYVGAGFPVFAGSRRQRGGSILGALKSMVGPVLSSLKSSVMKEGVGLLSDVVSDVTQGRSLGSSLKTRGLKRLGNVGNQTLSTILPSRKRRVSATAGAPATKRRRLPPRQQRRRQAPNF